jgi:hypothetical protein
MFKREKAFYEAHKAEFQEKYLNKRLVITGDSLFGAYDTIGGAFTAAKERLELGKFMLHTPADDGKVFSIPSFWIAEDEKELLPEPVITVAGGDIVSIPYAR